MPWQITVLTLTGLWFYSWPYWPKTTWLLEAKSSESVQQNYQGGRMSLRSCGQIDKPVFISAKPLQRNYSSRPILTAELMDLRGGGVKPWPVFWRINFMLSVVMRLWFELPLWELSNLKQGADLTSEKHFFYVLLQQFDDFRFWFVFTSWIDLFIFWWFCFEVALPSKPQQMVSGTTVTFLCSQFWALVSTLWCKSVNSRTLRAQEAESRVVGRKESMPAVLVSVREFLAPPN